MDKGGINVGFPKVDPGLQARIKNRQVIKETKTRPAADPEKVYDETYETVDFKGGPNNVREYHTGKFMTSVNNLIDRAEYPDIFERESKVVDKELGKIKRFTERVNKGPLPPGFKYLPDAWYDLMEVEKSKLQEEIKQIKEENKDNESKIKAIDLDIEKKTDRISKIDRVTDNAQRTPGRVFLESFATGILMDEMWGLQKEVRQLQEDKDKVKTNAMTWKFDVAKIEKQIEVIDSYVQKTIIPEEPLEKQAPPANKSDS